jgi:hypothetical protein
MTWLGSALIEGDYRYWLRRDADAAAAALPAAVCWVMLNPSTADGTTDDNTIRRCLGFTRSLGHRSMVVVNLYAWRSKEPEDLLTPADPVGPDNSHHLHRAAGGAQIILAAWGAWPGPAGKAHAQRVAEVLSRYRVVHCLALTADQQPRHPLYLRKDLQPVVYRDHSGAA